jgi:hypothetical protein
MKVDAVWERLLEESDYKYYVRKTSTGFITTSTVGSEKSGCSQSEKYLWPPASASHPLRPSKSRVFEP